MAPQLDNTLFMHLLNMRQKEVDYQRQQQQVAMQTLGAAQIQATQQAQQLEEQKAARQRQQFMEETKLREEARLKQATAFTQQMKLQSQQRAQQETMSDAANKAGELYQQQVDQGLEAHIPARFSSDPIAMEHFVEGRRRAAVNRMVEERRRQFELRRAKVGAPKTTITTGARTEAQKEVRKGMETLMGVRRIRETPDEVLNTVFSMPGRVKGWTFSKLIDANVDTVAEEFTDMPKGEIKQYVGQAKAVRNEVQQTFLNYRRAMTGAAGSDQEMKQIADAFLDKFSNATELRAAMDQIARKTAEVMAANDAYARSGGDIKDLLQQMNSNQFESHVTGLIGLSRAEMGKQAPQQQQGMPSQGEDFGSLIEQFKIEGF